MTLKSKTRSISLFFFVAFLCSVISTYAQDKLLDIMQNEMTRELSILKKQDSPPYYMSYRVNEVWSTQISSSFGNTLSSTDNHNRTLTVNVRVGDYNLDNTREIRGSEDYMDYLSMIPSSTRLPLDDNQEGISQVLWKETNSKYREAVDKLAKVKTNVAVKVAAEDNSADFSKQDKANIYFDEPFRPDELSMDVREWESKVNQYSVLFLQVPDIYGGNASVSYTAERKYFVSSEGSKIAQNMTFARLMISGYIKSDDGMELPLYKSYFSFNLMGLPPDEQIINDVKEMIAKLKALKTAPVVDPYSGPAIMSGRASGVFFHEIFGHRVEGHRQKKESEGQTFKKKVGERILPKHMSVIARPGQKKLGTQDLNGYYLYDDEGVKGEDVVIIKDGILNDFLMSRVPFEKFPRSNGHGRAQAGYQPVSRQSNLIIETRHPMPMEELRKKLIDECKKQGKEYGYLFSDITGGFTITGRSIPNSFNVMPTEVWRIFTDGRPDQLVRGVDLVGTPLAMFSEIAEAGDLPEVFIGTCGAESGGVPVTACSPALFINKIEMQKKEKSQERPPILSRPDAKIP